MNRRAEGEENTTGQPKLWKNMDRDDLAEFATIFVFEVYLEKRFYEETIIGTNIVDAVGSPVTPGSTQAAMKDLLSPSDANKPSDVPIPHPTTHDVLFGRGYVIFYIFVVSFALVLQILTHCFHCLSSRAIQRHDQWSSRKPTIP